MSSLIPLIETLLFSLIFKKMQLRAYEMRVNEMNKRRTRKQDGTALVETPGALIILFIFILFPLLDMIALGLKYACCYSLHQLQVREAALLPASTAQANNGPVKSSLARQWKDSGLGSFVDLEQLPLTVISYENGNRAANGVTDKYVVLSNQFRLKPFLNVPTPNLPEVPGLTSALVYSFESKRPMENPANVDK